MRQEFLDKIDAKAKRHRNTKSRQPEYKGESNGKGREAALEGTITKLQNLLIEEREKNAYLCEEVRVARRDKELMKDGLRTTCTSLARANQRLDEYRRVERREDTCEEVQQRNIEREWALRVSNYQAPYVEDFEDERDELPVYSECLEYEWIGKREE
jgi:hypothetical protein